MKAVRENRSEAGFFLLRKYRALFMAALAGYVVGLMGSMADSVVAGLLLNEDAVSAVGLVTPAVTLCTCVAVLFTYGISYRYGNAVGAMEKERSERISGTGLVSSVFAGLFLMGLLTVFKPAFFALYDCSESIMAQAESYYDCFIFYFAFLPVYYSFYFLVYADGDEKIILLTDVASAAGNVIFSAVFASGYGTAGLAMGTVVSVLISWAVLMSHFLSGKNSVRFRLCLDFRELCAGMALSTPAAFAYLYTALLDMIMNKLILLLMGECYLPAYTVVNSLINMTTVFNTAICSGSCLVTVYSGEENPGAVRRVMKTVTKYNVWTAVIFTVLLEFLAPCWPSLYGITDAAVSAASVFAGRIIPVTYLAMAMAYELIGYYPLIARNMLGNFLSAMTGFAAPLLLAVPAACLSGFYGMCAGFALAPVLTMLSLFLYFVFKKELREAPLLLKKTEEKEANYDLCLTEEGIVKLRNAAGEFLEKEGVSARIRTKVCLILEETLLCVMRKNRRKVYAEVSLLVSGERVRLILRDEGEIFDLTKEADDSMDLSGYVAARIMQNAALSRHTVATSFNRNSFIWKRNEVTNG